ncbi:hypothetical protein FHS91_002803 [Sphingobium xanthum]|uniref:hypothetical protein n=1 Tax=Sphingobium xanthum TaxID=1387165 RepID=UPI001C8C17D7|nr:hypothetical protein [Sphingobium xanthum]
MAQMSEAAAPRHSQYQASVPPRHENPALVNRCRQLRHVEAKISRLPGCFWMKNADTRFANSILDALFQRDRRSSSLILTEYKRAGR